MIRTLLLILIPAALLAQPLTLTRDSVTGNLNRSFDVPTGKTITFETTSGLVLQDLTIAPAKIAQGGATSGQVLVWNGSAWAPSTAAGLGDAMVASPLSQFAATTSAQLAGVITNETGTGALVFGTSPVLGGATITGASVTGSTALSVLDDGASDSVSLVFGDNAAPQTLTFNLNSGDRTIDLGGNVTLAGALTTSGANAITFTTTGATSLTLPTTGTLTSTAVANSWGDGVKQTFNPNGTNAGLNVGSHTADPSSLANGDLWYDSTAGTLDARIGGVTAQMLSNAAIDTSAELAAILTDETGTGALVFGTSPAFTTGITIGGVSVPTISSTHTLTNKTLGSGTATSDDVRITFNPGTNNAGINVGAHTVDPSSPLDGDLFYDSDDELLRAYVNGAWMNLKGGDVFGPSSATDNALARFDGATGKLIQNSTVTLSDTGVFASTLSFGFKAGADGGAGASAGGTMVGTGGYSSASAAGGAGGTISFAGGSADAAGVGGAGGAVRVNGGNATAGGAGGAGGSVLLQGAASSVAGAGGAGGTVDLRGGAPDSSEAGGAGGTLNLKGGAAGAAVAGGDGGTISAVGAAGASGGWAGGSLSMDGTALGSGGSINTSGGGGEINTSGGGGQINTTAGGAIITGTGDLTGPNSSGTLTINDIANAWADGVKQTFNPNGTTAGLNVGSQAGDPSAPANGDLWYDSTANELTARIGGSNVALGAGGGGSVATDGIWDAKGDLAVGTGANTASKLTVGTDGHVLTAASGEATGTKWAALTTLGTEQASTSGTSIDFTGIPAGTKRITIHFVGVSTSGTSNVIVQIGDSGGVETTTYNALAQTASTLQASTTGFIVNGSAWVNTYTLNGSLTLNLEDASDFTWVSGHTIYRGGTDGMHIGAGTKALSAELDRVRITTAGGSDTFDAGVVNITIQQ